MIAPAPKDTKTNAARQAKRAKDTSLKSGWQNGGDNYFSIHKQLFDLFGYASADLINSSCKVKVFFAAEKSGLTIPGNYFLAGVSFIESRKPIATFSKSFS